MILAMEELLFLLQRYCKKTLFCYLNSSRDTRKSYGVNLIEFFFFLMVSCVYILCYKTQLEYACIFVNTLVDRYVPRIFVSFFDLFWICTFLSVLSVCIFTFSLFIADRCACTYIPPMIPLSWLFYLPLSWILENGRHLPPILLQNYTSVM